VERLPNLTPLVRSTALPLAEPYELTILCGSHPLSVAEGAEMQDECGLRHTWGSTR